MIAAQRIINPDISYPKGTEVNDTISRLILDFTGNYFQSTVRSVTALNQIIPCKINARRDNFVYSRNIRVNSLSQK
ncbi:MAG TPA: hypothetical protein ENK06_02690 [Gammaproteobacteria bacterium]|nr:hypothetical protein [Gammaproteobacteria bacterium]